MNEILPVEWWNQMITVPRSFMLLPCIISLVLILILFIVVGLKNEQDKTHGISKKAQPAGGKEDQQEQKSDGKETLPEA